jgi:hypothetical protein
MIRFIGLILGSVSFGVDALVAILEMVRVLAGGVVEVVEVLVEELLVEELLKEERGRKRGRILGRRRDIMCLFVLGFFFLIEKPKEK